MTLHIGHYFWVPCEVKPGPFSDERVVRVRSELDDWIGFAPVSYLKEPIAEGETQICALIVDVRDDKFVAKIPGESMRNTLYFGVISRAREFDTVQT